MREQNINTLGTNRLGELKHNAAKVGIKVDEVPTVRSDSKNAKSTNNSSL